MVGEVGWREREARLGGRESVRLVFFFFFFLLLLFLLPPFFCGNCGSNRLEILMQQGTAFRRGFDLHSFGMAHMDEAKELIGLYSTFFVFLYSPLSLPHGEYSLNSRHQTQK